MEQVKKYVELIEKKRNLDAELRTVKGELDILEAQVMDYLTEIGLQSVKTEGGQTVYLNRMIYAKAKDGNTQAIVDGLESAGFRDLITVNHNTFGSFVREQIEQYKAVHPEAKALPVEELEVALPEALRGRVDLGEKVSVRVRKA